jgi:O-antigen/teichoic acid export membrane protein
MSRTAPRLAWNVALLGAGRALGLAASALTLAALARLLGPAEFGRYTFATVYIAFFSTVIDQGVNTSVAVRMSGHRDAEAAVLGNAIGLKLAISGAAFALAVAAVRLPWFRADSRDLVAIAALLIPVTALGVVNVLFQVRLNTVPVVCGDLAARLGLLALVYFAGLRGLAATRVMAYQVLTAAAGLALVMAAAARLSSVRPRFDWAEWRAILVPALPLTGSFTLGMLYFRFDALMVSFVRGDAAMGVYGVAFRIVDLFLLLPGLVMPVVFPLLVAQCQAPRAELQATVRRLLDVMAMVALPCAVFLTFQAGHIVRLVAGPGFEAAATSLALLAWSMAAIFVSNALGYVLFAAGLQATSLKISLASAVANVVLNLLLTPRFGAIGAASSAVATQVAVLVITQAAVSRLLQLSPWPGAWRHVVATSASIALALTLVRASGGGFVLGAVVAAAGFAGGVLASATLRADLRSVFPSRTEAVVR